MIKNKRFGLFGLTLRPTWICFAIAGILGIFGLLFYIGHSKDAMTLMLIAAIFPFLIGLGTGVLESMRYEFALDCIKLSFAFLPFPVAKWKYKDCSGFVIAYALASGGRYGMTYYMTSNIPARSNVSAKPKKKKLPAFLFVLPHGYDISNLSVGMTRAKERRWSYPAPRTVARFDFAAFQELLRYTDVPIRILEDVYLENATAFDESIERIPSAAERCFVVSGSHIPYVRYKELLKMRKEP